MELNSRASRRTVLKSACGFITLSALAADQDDPGAPAPGDTLVFSDGPNQGKAVRFDDLVVGAHPVTAQVQDSEKGAPRDSDHSTVLLLRFTPENVPPDAMDYAAQGVLAFSAVCTHLGCLLTDWIEDRKVIQCPCHGATFDPMKAGKWAGDGPSVRPIPILPLKVADDGKLVVADVFTGTVGPKKA